MTHPLSKSILLIALWLVGSVMMSSLGATPENRPTKRVSPPPQCNPNAVVWRTPEPPADPQKGDIWVNPKDGMEMVYIAPGEFVMGTSEAEIGDLVRYDPKATADWFRDERPQCHVNLGACWIGRTEVTNAQYLRFVKATGCRAPSHWKAGRVPAGLENFPVVFLDWDDAQAYCEWAGGRLPTEPEWEKAARGSDGRVFPWGFGWQEGRCRSFIGLTGRKYSADREWVSARQTWEHTHNGLREGLASVAAHPGDAGPWGCLGMAGNAMELCADWYGEETYRSYAQGRVIPPENKLEVRVLRGGSWRDGNPLAFRCARRSFTPHSSACNYIGFRCARDAG